MKHINFNYKTIFLCLGIVSMAPLAAMEGPEVVGQEQQTQGISSQELYVEILHFLHNNSSTKNLTSHDYGSGLAYSYTSEDNGVEIKKQADDIITFRVPAEKPVSPTQLQIVRETKAVARNTYNVEPEFNDSVKSIIAKIQQWYTENETSNKDDKRMNINKSPAILSIPAELRGSINYRADEIAHLCDFSPRQQRSQTISAMETVSPRQRKNSIKQLAKRLSTLKIATKVSAFFAPAVADPIVSDPVENRPMVSSAETLQEAFNKELKQKIKEHAERKSEEKK